MGDVLKFVRPQPILERGGGRNLFERLAARQNQDAELARAHLRRVAKKLREQARQREQERREMWLRLLFPPKA